MLPLNNRYSVASSTKGTNNDGTNSSGVSFKATSSIPASPFLFAGCYGIGDGGGNGGDLAVANGATAAATNFAARTNFAIHEILGLATASAAFPMGTFPEAAAAAATATRAAMEVRQQSGIPSYFFPTNYYQSAGGILDQTFRLETAGWKQAASGNRLSAYPTTGSIHPHQHLFSSPLESSDCTSFLHPQGNNDRHQQQQHSENEFSGGQQDYEIGNGGCRYSFQNSIITLCFLLPSLTPKFLRW